MKTFSDILLSMSFISAIAFSVVSCKFAERPERPILKKTKVALVTADQQTADETAGESSTDQNPIESTTTEGADVELPGVADPISVPPVVVPPVVVPPVVVPPVVVPPIDTNMDKTIGYECSSRAPQDQSFYAVEIFCKASINGRVMSREEFFRVKRIQWPTIYGNAAVNARGSVSPNETIVIEVYNQDSVENTTAFIKEIKLDVREDVSIGSRVTVGLWDLVHSNGHKLIYTFWKSPEYKVTCTYSLTEAWSILCQVKLEGRIITSKDKSFYPIRMLPSTPTAIAYTLYGANTKDPGNIGNNTFKVSFDDLGSPFPAPNQTSVDTALQLLKLELLFKSTLGQSKKVSISDLLVR